MNPRSRIYGTDVLQINVNKRDSRDRGELCGAGSQYFDRANSLIYQTEKLIYLNMPTSEMLKGKTDERTSTGIANCFKFIVDKTDVLMQRQKCCLQKQNS